MTGTSPDSPRGLLPVKCRAQRCFGCQSHAELQGILDELPLCFPALVGQSGLQQPIPTKAARGFHHAPASPLWEGHLSPSCLPRLGPQASKSTRSSRAKATAQPVAYQDFLSHGAVAEAALLTEYCSSFAALCVSGRT